LDNLDSYRFEWSKENINALIEENKLGQAIYQRLDTLDAWIQESPSANVLRLLNIWNQSCKRRKIRKGSKLADG
jgi:hypothetical protein